MDLDLKVLENELAVLHREGGLVPVLSAVDAVARDVEGIAILLIELRPRQKEPGFVPIGLALVDAKGGTVATLVAQVVYVEDLAALCDLERLLADYHESPAPASEHGHHPVHR